jgi:VCBS repeat-containing protein
MAKAMGSGLTPNYTLSMSYDTATPASDVIQGKIGIIALDTMGNWINAADGNNSGTKRFVLGAALGSDSLGAYGVDTATHTAWAVINYTSDFAVAGFAVTGNASASPQNRASQNFRVRMSGTRLILPAAFANNLVKVELFSLDGRLLYRETVSRNVVDLSAVRKTAGSRELVVKCDNGKMQVLQKLAAY